MKKTIEQRFWEKVKKGGDDECWLWIGARNNAGYGNIKAEGKYINGHRLSYKIHFGEIKKGMYICHKCDNPSCVNPKHLFMGIPQENDNDKVKKQRQSRGEKHPISKLTEELVRKIRKESGSHQSLSIKYNVSRRLIGMVKQKSIWKHVQ